jgi:lipopolysaccharide/colanic/teichoic acid biosynthesis glycosyltransferase
MKTEMSDDSKYIIRFMYLLVSGYIVFVSLVLMIILNYVIKFNASLPSF